MTQEQQSEAAMHQAFQQFMITGGSSDKRKKKKKGQQHQVHEDKQPPPLNPEELVILEENRELQVIQKITRKYWQIVNAFQGTLQRDWIEVDDNLSEVISSISNLRSRIYMESKRLVALRQNQRQGVSWKGYGYKGNEKHQQQGITIDDIELSMDHDLMQHEKMMAGTRMLLSSLSEAQDTLGRRLEELFAYHLESLQVCSLLQHFDVSSLETVMATVDTLNDVFAMLATELHRKQCLSQTVLNSASDGLLCSSDSQEQSAEGIHSRLQRMANFADRDWPRGCSKSLIDTELLATSLKLGESNTNY